MYEPTIATKSPNILVLVADDFGYNDVSWNNPEMFTPELEKLARDGVILDTFYSQPRCSPSRASLLTGLYPFRMGIQRGNVSPFRPSGLSTQFKLLPQILKTKGYSTHLIGKIFFSFIDDLKHLFKVCGTWATATEIIFQQKEVLILSLVI